MNRLSDTAEAWLWLVAILALGLMIAVSILGVLDLVGCRRKRKQAAA